MHYHPVYDKLIYFVQLVENELRSLQLEAFPFHDGVLKSLLLCFFLSHVLIKIYKRNYESKPMGIFNPVFYSCSGEHLTLRVPLESPVFPARGDFLLPPGQEGRWMEVHRPLYGNGYLLQQPSHNDRFHGRLSSFRDRMHAFRICRMGQERNRYRNRNNNL